MIKQLKRRMAAVLTVLLILQAVPAENFLSAALMPGMLISAQAQTESGETAATWSDGREEEREDQEDKEPAPQEDAGSEPQVNGEDAQGEKAENESNILPEAGDADTPATFSNAVVTVLDKAETGTASDATAPLAEDSEATPSDARVLLFYQSEGSLGTTPQRDAEAMKRTLLRLDGFAEEEIAIVPVPYDEDGTGTPGETMLEAIRNIGAKTDENEMKIVYYSGHGINGSTGASFLQLGDDAERDWLSAAALRDALSETRGEVFLMLDACYSGGMLLAANDLWEENTDDPQEEADAFAENFVRVFQSAQGRQSRSSYGSRFKIAVAATQMETALLRPLYGSDLTAAFGHMAGYDRNVTDIGIIEESYTEKAYNTAAGDIDRDREISLQEFAAYCKKLGIKSDPVFFPQNDKTVLFSYHRAAGADATADTDNAEVIIPAVFDAELLENPMLKAFDTGKTADNGQRLYLAEAEIQIKNLGDREISLELEGNAGDWISAYTAGNFAETVRLREMLESAEAGSLRSLPTATQSVAAKSSVTVQLPILIEEQQLLGLGVIRISTKESASSYQILPFYAVPEEGGSMGEIDKSALAILSPWETDADTKPQTVYLKSADGEENSLPVKVRFDTDPPERKGYAPCLLTLRVYPEQAGSGTQIPSADAVVRTLYESFHPQYGRDETGEMQTLHSTYTVHWDLKDTTGNSISPGSYRLSLEAIYDDGTTGISETLIDVEETAPREEISYISSYAYTEGWFEIMEPGGFNSAAFSLVGRNPRDLHTELRTVRWEDEAGNPIEAAEAEAEPGKVYRSFHEVRISDTNVQENAAGIRQLYRFSPKSELRVAGHEVQNVSVTDDGRILHFELIHRTLPADPETDIRLYAEATDAFVESGENLISGTKVWVLLTQDSAGKAKVSLYDIYYAKDGQTLRLLPDEAGAYSIPEGIETILIILKSDMEGTCGYYSIRWSCTEAAEPETPDPETPDPETPEPETPSPEYPGGSEHSGSSSSGTGSSNIGTAYFGKTLYTAQNWSYVEYLGQKYWRYRADDGAYCMNGWYRAGWNGTEAWYFFDEKGFMKTGWVTDPDGRSYYLNPKSDGTLGSMLTGWQEIDGKACYFRESSPYQGEYLPDAVR